MNGVIDRMQDRRRGREAEPADELSVGIDTATGAHWMDAYLTTVTGYTLDQVIGAPAACREAQSLVARLRFPEIIKAAGADMPRGLVLYGPPGTGKTLLARVIASLLAETHAVEFYSLAASDLSGARFGDLTKWLDHRSRTRPEIMTVIYIDEVDLWAMNRSHHTMDPTTRATLLGALSCIDGISQDSANRVLWLMSSNRHPAELDPALVRPLRIGCHIQLAYPTQREREEILRFYASTRRVDPTIDWRRAASLCGARTSPAALRQYLDDALALALVDDGPTATVTYQHLSEAIRRDGKIEDERPWSEAEQMNIAVHEAGHAVIGHLLGRTVTAMSMRRDGAVTESTIGDEEGEYSGATDQQMLDLMCSGLAGFMAERVILGEYRMGATSDIGNVTSIARNRVSAGTDDGMGSRVNPAYFDDSPAANDAWYRAVAASIASEEKRACALISQHRESIVILARRLVEQQHLSGPELRAAFIAAGLRVSAVEPEEAAA